MRCRVLSFGLTRLGDSWHDILGWAMLAGALLLLAAFAGWQRRAASPLVPPSIWRQPNFTAVIAIGVCLYAGWVGVNFFAAGRVSPLG